MFPWSVNPQPTWPSSWIRSAISVGIPWPSKNEKVEWLCRSTKSSDFRTHIFDMIALTDRALVGFHLLTGLSKSANRRNCCSIAWRIGRCVLAAFPTNNSVHGITCYDCCSRPVFHICPSRIRQSRVILALLFLFSSHCKASECHATRHIFLWPDHNSSASSVA